MSTRARNQGFSLLEVILALTVLVVGALVALTVIATTSNRNEKGKINAVAYKACQDMTEVLMSMPYADMTNLKTWSVNNAKPLVFDVQAAGFPRMPSGQFVQGTYTLTDITSNATYGFAAGTTNKIWEIVVRIDFQDIHVSIITRRKDPAYQ